MHTITLLLLARVFQVAASPEWLSYALKDVKVNTTEDCNKAKSLLPQQRILCKEEPKSMLYVSQGVKLALTECQSQFQHERWNCSTKSFNTLVNKGTKEAAFIYAISSAAVTHSLARACSTGEMTTCSCAQPSKRRRRKRNKNNEPWPNDWEWGGCSDNIRYGLRYGKKFVDAAEDETHESSRDSRSLMNLHNNEAGRKIVSRFVQTQCRCHGVSGACAVQTCWRELSRFSKIGSELKRLYSRSSIKVAERRGTKLKPADKSLSKRDIKRHSLVYLKSSPDFCSPHSELGINGVTDRECNRTSSGVDGCPALCCGRGYNTQILKTQERCNCKFHWCCHVSCKTCHITKEIYTCK